MLGACAVAQVLERHPASRPLSISLNDSLLLLDAQDLPLVQPELDDEIQVYSEGKRLVDKHRDAVRVLLLPYQPGDGSRL